MPLAMVTATEVPDRVPLGEEGTLMSSSSTAKSLVVLVSDRVERRSNAAIEWMAVAEAIIGLARMVTYRNCNPWNQSPWDFGAVIAFTTACVVAGIMGGILEAISVQVRMNGLAMRGRLPRSMQ